MNIKKPNSFARHGNDYVAPLTTIDQIVKPSGERYTDKEFELMSNVENVMFGENSAGKNLLNPTLQTTTSNGVTCTNNGDGTYTLNGTATNVADFTLLPRDFYEDYGKTTKLVGTPKTENTGIKMTFWVHDGNLSNAKFYGHDTGDGLILEHGNFKYYAGVIRDENGTTVNNAIFKPMITTDISATYDDFEPYIKSLKQLTDSALNMDLLWANASPNNAFASQTINLDLSQYKSFIILYISQTGNINSGTAQYYPSTGFYTFSWVYFTLSQNMFRQVEISKTGIKFYDCQINGTSIDNIRMIPYKIYGVR